MRKVLFLCTGNSCRSIMAEGLLNHYGKGKYQAYSAGSFPTGKVLLASIATLERHGIAPTDYRSKSWDEFTAHPLDIVITVCDNAAGETCPIFPGAPVKAHWGAPDPAHFQGTEQEIETEFNRVFAILERRVKALVALPDTLEKVELTTRLKAIGEIA